MRSLATVLALLASSAIEPSIDVSVSPTELRVGDRAEVTLAVRIGDDVPMGAISWPEWSSTLGGAEILEVSTVEARSLPDGSRLVSQTLSVAFFEIGRAAIPALGVDIAVADGSRRLTSEPVPLEVVSVLPETGAEVEPKPPAPPQRLGMGQPFWWASGALFATGLLALALLFGTTRGLDDALPTIAPAPRAELEAALGALRRETDAGALHAGLSISMRRFLGRTLGFAAPESTTSEVRRELRRLDFDPELAARVDRLLGTCDMVMFAGRLADVGAGARRIDETGALADRLEEWLAAQRQSEPEHEEAA